jgi:hypothetical protein
MDDLAHVERALYDVPWEAAWEIQNCAGDPSDDYTCAIPPSTNSSVPVM